MITKDDLKEQTRQNYLSALNQLGKTEEWGQTALNEKRLEDWETPKGSTFGLFFLPSFQQQVAKKMGRKEVMTIDNLKIIVDGDRDYVNNTLVPFINGLEERIIKLEEQLNAITRK